MNQFCPPSNSCDLLLPSLPDKSFFDVSAVHTTLRTSIHLYGDDKTISKKKKFGGSESPKNPEPTLATSGSRCIKGRLQTKTKMSLYVLAYRSRTSNTVDTVSAGNARSADCYCFPLGVITISNRTIYTETETSYKRSKALTLRAAALVC